MDSNLGSQDLYGDPTSDVVDNANASLADSPIKLAWAAADTKSIITGISMSKGRKKQRIKPRKTFTRIKPVHDTHGEDKAMTLLKDCGKNAREIIGGSAVVEYFESGSDVASTTPAASPLLALAEVMKKHFPAKAMKIDTLVNEYQVAKTGGVAGVISTKRRALDTYLANRINALSFHDKQELEEEALINSRAKPLVGEGVVIVGAGPQRAGAAKKWQFHMAPVVIESDDEEDYVTLENFNTPIGPDRNQSWNFNMYGRTRHTIHDIQAEQADGEFGRNPMTLVVKKT
jgi:hypothetical protein